MEDSKCGSVPMQEKPDLSKAQGEKTPSEVNLNFSKILVKLTGLMLKAYRRGGVNRVILTSLKFIKL
ncbi:hypothetical protein Tco_0809962 [Tanacetum coccineum]